MGMLVVTTIDIQLYDDDNDRYDDDDDDDDDQDDDDDDNDDEDIAGHIFQGVGDDGLGKKEKEVVLLRQSTSYWVGG